MKKQFETLEDYLYHFFIVIRRNTYKHNSIGHDFNKGLYNCSFKYEEEIIDTIIIALDIINDYHKKYSSFTTWDIWETWFKDRFIKIPPTSVLKDALWIIYLQVKLHNKL